MNVTDIQTAHANAEFVRLQQLEDERVREFHRWWAEHAEHTVVSQAFAYLVEILALDDLRCKAAGYSPQPWQNIFRNQRIIEPATLASCLKFYGEAKH